MTPVPSRPKGDIIVVVINDYEVLGISEKATGPEIDEAFRRKAVKNNPGLGRVKMSSAEARRESEKLRVVIEAREAIKGRREGLIAAILENIRGIKQGAV